MSLRNISIIILLIIFIISITLLLSMKNKLSNSATLVSTLKIQIDSLKAENKIQSIQLDSCLNIDDSSKLNNLKRIY